MSVIKILLVDDFVAWQVFMRDMFELEADFKIIGTANDGVEAVQKATEAQPDVILMDIGLPKLNGFEAAHHIRMLSPASRILFLTEHRGSDFVNAAFKAGGLGYVLKVSANSDLITGIRTILSGQCFVSRDAADW
jgi:DNA-binding NarL/FixJ family response regulator